MPFFELALPGVLLLTKSLLKLVVGRPITLPDFVAGLLALPVDIVFLSASLLAGHVISSAGDAKMELAIFIMCLALALVIVALWRCSESLFMQDHYWRTGGVGFANITLSGATLLYAVSVLSVGATK